MLLIHSSPQTHEEEKKKKVQNMCEYKSKRLGL